MMMKLAPMKALEATASRKPLRLSAKKCADPAAGGGPELVGTWSIGRTASSGRSSTSPRASFEGLDATRDRERDDEETKKRGKNKK